MAINKVVYGGDTLIDLTSDTVTPPKLKIGAVAHAANGSTIEGELAGVYYGTTAPSPSDAPVWIDPSGTANAIGTEDVKYKIYNSVTDLGLTAGSATIAGAFSALASDEILICPASEFSSTERPMPQYSAGLVEMIHLLNGACSILFYGDTSGYGDYRMFTDGNGVPTGAWIPQDYSFVKEGVTVFRKGRLRIVRLDSPSAWCATLYAEDAPSNDARVLSKVYNGSDYVDCNVSVGSDGTVKVLSLWGSEIVGAQYNFLVNKYVTYFV